jgi:hypothetical protein
VKTTTPPADVLVGGLHEAGARPGAHPAVASAAGVARTARPVATVVFHRHRAGDRRRSGRREPDRRHERGAAGRRPSSPRRRRASRPARRPSRDRPTSAAIHRSMAGRRPSRDRSAARGTRRPTWPRPRRRASPARPRLGAGSRARRRRDAGALRSAPARAPRGGAAPGARSSHGSSGTTAGPTARRARRARAEPSRRPNAVRYRRRAEPRRREWRINRRRTRPRDRDAVDADDPGARRTEPDGEKSLVPPPKSAISTKSWSRRCQ